MIDVALSDRLRAKLGIVEEAAIATAREIRALRAILRLSRAQLAQRWGMTPRQLTSWEREQRGIRPRPATAARMMEDLTVARAEQALAYDPATEKRAPAIRSPRYERPPSNLTYFCLTCHAGLPDKAPLPWHRVRRAKQGGENWEHGRKGHTCGPVVPHKDLQHMALVQAQQQEAKHA